MKLLQESVEITTHFSPKIAQKNRVRNRNLPGIICLVCCSYPLITSASPTITFSWPFEVTGSTVLYLYRHDSSLTVLFYFPATSTSLRIFLLDWIYFVPTYNRKTMSKCFFMLVIFFFVENIPCYLDRSSPHLSQLT